MTDVGNFAATCCLVVGGLEAIVSETKFGLFRVTIRPAETYRRFFQMMFLVAGVSVLKSRYPPGN